MLSAARIEQSEIPAESKHPYSHSECLQAIPFVTEVQNARWSLKIQH